MTTIFEILGVVIPVAIFAYSYFERFRIERYISARFVRKIVRKWRKNLDAEAYSPTLIIGLGRGGSYVGSLLTNEYGHKPYAVIDLEHCWIGSRRRDFLRYDLKFRIETNKMLLDKVLIVSGEMNTRKSLEYAIRYLEKCGAKQIRALTVYARSSAIIGKDEGVNKVLHTIERISEKTIRTPWRNTQDYVQGKTPGRRCEYIGKILFIRHCESITNSYGDRFDDPLADPPLTDKGVQQSKYLAKSLVDDYMIDAIYSSDFRRTKQSALPLSEKLGISITIEPSLAEVSFGEWNGKKYLDVEKEFPEEYIAFRRANWNFPPSGSNFHEALELGLRFLRRIGAEMIEKNIEVVAAFTHMNLIQLIITEINRQDKNSFRGINVPNCSVTMVIVNMKEDDTLCFSVYNGAFE
jgi:broad specificity phosphatase PhoE/hypoxanthine phosphoribosyltransferase